METGIDQKDDDEEEAKVGTSFWTYYIKCYHEKEELPLNLNQQGIRIHTHLNTHYKAYEYIITLESFS